MTTRRPILVQAQKRILVGFVFLIALWPVLPALAAEIAPPPLVESQKESSPDSTEQQPQDERVDTSKDEPRDPDEPGSLPEDDSTDDSHDDEKPESATLATSMPVAPLPTLQTPSTVKTLRPQIDEASGALGYTFPLAIPPGRNGLQPDLSLTYNNQDRRDGSVVGFGWSLSIPSIERLNKTGSEQMYNVGTFSSSLDGEIVSASWGYYYAKVDRGDLREYQPVGDTWIMVDKVGTLYTFGATVSARQDNPTNPSQVYRWMISEIRDRNDNFISFAYDKIGGQIYPTSITYTGHGATPGIFEVAFVRESRPDIRKDYRSAFLVQTDERISNITMKVDGAPVRSYALGYTTGQDGSRSMLANITESGIDESGNTVSLPPTTFTYESQPSRTYTTPSSWAAPFHVTTPPSGVLVADVNSDGLPDLLKSLQFPAPQPLIQEAYLNTGSNWVSDPTWLPPPFPFASFNGPTFSVQAIDINGDGRVDLIRSLPLAREAWLNTGAGWVLDSAYSNFNFSQDPWQNDQGARLVDVNGDDLPDWIRQNSGNTTLQLNTGAGWGSVQNNPLHFNVPYSVGATAAGVTFADVNADGLVDIMAARAFAPNEAYLNTGTGWVAEPGFAPPIDFVDSGNGDEGIRPVDLDNNGLPDIGRRSPGTNYGWLNTGAGWTSQFTSVWVPGGGCDFADGGLQNATQFADLNGDALMDWFCTSGTNPIPTTFAIINTGTQNDVLTQIEFPLGGTSVFTFQATPMYLDASGVRLNPTLPYVMQTVRTITHDDGLGTISSSTFQYEGGSYYYASATERKFAGFHSIAVADAGGFTTTTWYHQGNGTDAVLGEATDHIAKAGMPFRVEVEDAVGNLVRTIVNTWDRSDLVGVASFVKLASTVSLDYDGNVDHRDKAVSYTYDASSTNVLSKIEWGEVSASADGAFVDIGSDKRTTSWLYAYNGSMHILGLPKQEIVVNQSGVLLSQTLSYYDGLPLGSVNIGNLTREELWKVGASFVDVERTYNAFGFMTSQLDPLNHATTFTPDMYNLYPASITNALNHVTSFLYDYSSGTPTQVTDVNGKIFQTIYDGLDRVVEEKQPNVLTPSVLETKTTYSYTSQTVGMRTLKNDFLDASTSRDAYAYTDGFDRLIQTRVEAENTDTFSTTDTVYDTREYLSSQSLPYFGAGIARTAATTTPTLLTTFTYDALGRSTNIATAVGSTISSYDQWISTVTDPRGKIKTFTRDALDRLVSVIEHNGVASYTTTYAYNGRGDLTSLTDALGNTRSFTYDGLSRRLTAQDLHAPADTTFGTWTYVYDDASNLSSSLDPKAQTVQYTYDNLNRPLTENFIGATGIEVINVYDSCTNGVGRLCSTTKTGFSESRGYDPLGRLAAQTRTIESTPYATSFTYDRQGNQVTITNPDGSQVQYVYNSTGFLNGVNRKESTSSFTPVVSNIDYAPTGKRTVTLYANGKTTTNTYDDSELYRLRTKVTTPGNLQNLTYSYDPNGNVTQIVDASSTLSAKTTAYVYDDLNRLLSATVSSAADANNGTQSYTYNAIGNLSTRSDVGSYVYTGNVGTNYANPHAATTAGATSYTYDNNGNLATSAVTTIVTSTPPAIPTWYTSATDGVWEKRIAMTVNETMVNGLTELVNFPILVSVTNINLKSIANGGFVAQANGNDILFASADGVTKLNHEIESYNPVTGQLIAWVRIPSLSATVNTIVYAYLGNPTAASQQQSSGVWSTDYKAVWHLKDNPASTTTPQVLDSTANVNHATSYGSMPSSALTTGKIGQGILFDGVNDYLQTGTSASIGNLTNAVTVSVWILASNNTSGHHRFLSASKQLSTNGFGFGRNGPYARFSGYGLSEYTSTSLVSTIVWRRFDAVFSGGSVSFYRNGSLVSTYTNTWNLLANTDDVWRIAAGGAVGSAVASEFFGGRLDELRVTGAARSATWINAEYRNQNLPASYLTLGAVQSVPVPTPIPTTVTTTYAWDYGNRLASITSPTLSASFLYDADGTRVKSVLGGVTTQTPTTWYNVAGTTPTKHILLPDGEMLATVEGSNASAVTSYIHTDHLTGSALSTNASGVQTQLLDYHPFGTLRLNNQSSTFNEKRKFAGHEYDTETGLSYMQARYYEPATGRFLSEDPIFVALSSSFVRFLADPQQLNSYSYGRNNPLMYRDPDGNAIETVVDIAMGAYDVGRAVYWGTQTAGTYGAIGLSNLFLSQVSDNLSQQAEYAQGKFLDATVDAGIDAVGTAIPGVPAIALRAVKVGNETADATKAADRTYTVYRSIKNGATEYIGHTVNFVRRQAEHLRNGRSIESIKGLTNLPNRSTAKGAEQVLIERNGLSKNGGTLSNKINSIAPTNTQYGPLTNIGRAILQKLGGKK